IEVAKGNLSIAKDNLAFTSIKAPTDGVISKSSLNPGDLVNSYTIVLTTIVPQDPMNFYFEVDARTVENFKRLREEGKIKVQSEPNVRLTLADGRDYKELGTIDFVDNQINPVTGSLKVRARFPNPLVKVAGQDDKGTKPEEGGLPFKRAL